MVYYDCCSSGMLYRNNKRSLRSDKTSFISSTQMNAGTNNWKNSLSSTRRSSLPPFSNCHHLRSTKFQEKETKSDQNDPLQVLHNGVSSSHCYGTRYSGRNSVVVNQKLSITRQSNHWGDSLSEKHQHSLKTSHFIKLTEPDHLSSVANNLGHKLRSRHVCFSNNLISVAANVEGDARQQSEKHYEPLSLAKDIKECESSLSDILDIDELNADDVNVCKSLELKNCHIQGAKRKRLTAEEKLLQDNKAYYKLEVKNNKLRSSGYYLLQKERDVCDVSEELKHTELKDPKEEVVTYNGESAKKLNVKENASEKSVSTVVEVKRNKIRLSELSLLNNEAENFMFGESTSKSATDEESTEEDSINTGDNSNSFANRVIFCCSGGSKSQKLINSLEANKSRISVSELKFEGKDSQIQCNSIENDQSNHNNCMYSENNNFQGSHFGPEILFQQRNDNPIHDVSRYEENSFQFCSYASNDSDSIDNSQKEHKRQTLAETFVNDNIEAYKFEVSGLESCIQVSMFSHKSLKMQNKLESESNTESLVRANNEHNPCTSENIICVGVPICTDYEKHEFESTYVSRVEENSESNDFEMKHSYKCPDIKNEAVTGLHFSFEGIPESEPWYQTYQRQDEGEEFYLSSLNDCTYWKSFLLPYEMPIEQFNSSACGVGISKTGNTNNIKRRKRKNNSNNLDKKPRKSPRCHASTLAILSSLMHHRKRKESDKNNDAGISKTLDENVKELSGPPIAMKTNDTRPHREIKELAQNIDQLLGLYAEIGLSSDGPTASSNDLRDEMNCGKSHKIKTLKYKKSRSINIGNTKRNEPDKIYMKDIEGTDVDPVVLQELAASGENPLSCMDDINMKSRGGPCMDVISLLDCYGTCYCVEGLTKCQDRKRYEHFSQSPLKGIFNSSECASLCETVEYSEVTKNVIRMKSRKRKKKKNLTGWPVEKQKIKRRLLLKLARPEVQAPVLEIKVKDKDRRLAQSGDGSSSGLIRSKCVSSVHDSSNGEVEFSEISEIMSTENRSNFNDCAENCSRNNVNSKGVEAIVTDTELAKSSDSEFVSHGHMKAVSSPARITENLYLSRTTSVDSNNQHYDFQPRVRVRKMNSVTDINFVLKTSDSTSVINNTRQLRSTSFSSSSTIRNNLCHYDSVDTMEVVRRSSTRMKKSCNRWDSWSTRRRR